MAGLVNIFQSLTLERRPDSPTKWLDCVRDEVRFRCRFELARIVEAVSDGRLRGRVIDAVLERYWTMSLSEAVRATGTVAAVHRGDFHRVALDDYGHDVLARRCGKMVKKEIRCTVGDRVRVELTVYDPRRGRIVWREKPVGR